MDRWKVLKGLKGVKAIFFEERARTHVDGSSHRLASDDTGSRGQSTPNKWLSITLLGHEVNKL